MMPPSKYAPLSSPCVGLIECSSVPSISPFTVKVPALRLGRQQGLEHHVIYLKPLDDDASKSSHIVTTAAIVPGTINMRVMSSIVVPTPQ